MNPIPAPPMHVSVPPMTPTKDGFSDVSTAPMVTLRSFLIIILDSCSKGHITGNP